MRRRSWKCMARASGKRSEVLPVSVNSSPLRTQYIHKYFVNFTISTSRGNDKIYKKIIFLVANDAIASMFQRLEPS